MPVLGQNSYFRSSSSVGPLPASMNGNVRRLNGNFGGSMPSFVDGQNFDVDMRKAYMQEDSPSYFVEHLATFGVGPQFGLQWPSDGIRKLKQMERSSAIWAQRMILRLRHTAVVVEDENGDVVEQFPLNLVSEPTAHVSSDPRDLYNNLLVFIVNGSKGKKTATPTEMHIFQCVQVSASEVADDIKQFLRGRFKAVPTGRRISGFAMPSGGGVEGGSPEMTTTDGTSLLHGRSILNRSDQRYFNQDRPRVNTVPVMMENGRSPSNFNYREIDQKSTFSDSSVEFFERDVNILNRCFDDIERFVARIQSAAIAQRELEALQQQRRAMKPSSRSTQNRMPGDGILLMRAQLPPELEFFDILQKFKLCFNLLAKLKNHIHEPNAPELLHFLFTPLAIILDACQWGFGRNIAPQVVSPLISRAAKALLLNCLTSKESEIWASLGDAWRTTAEEWTGTLPDHYSPTFAHNYGPYSTSATALPDSGQAVVRQNRNFFIDGQLSGDFSRVSLERERLDFEKEKLQEEERRIQFEKRILEEERRRLLEEKRQFYEEQEQRSVVSERLPRPPPAANGLYSSTMSRSRPDLYRETLREQESRRNFPPPSVTDDASFFFEQARARGSQIAQVVYERHGMNEKELTVRKGEFLEVLNNKKNWWECRNAHRQVGFVPHTILSVVDSGIHHNNSSALHQQSSKSFDEPLFVRPPPPSTSTFGPAMGNSGTAFGSYEDDSAKRSSPVSRTATPANNNNGNDTPEVIRQRRDEPKNKEVMMFSSTCLVNSKRPYVACAPPVPPPAPPPPPPPQPRTSGGVETDEKKASTSNGTIAHGMLNEELLMTLNKSNLKGSFDFKAKPWPSSSLVTVQEMSSISSKQDVAEWLQANYNWYTLAVLVLLVAVIAYQTLHLLNNSNRSWFSDYLLHCFESHQKNVSKYLSREVAFYLSSFDMPTPAEDTSVLQSSLTPAKGTESEALAVLQAAELFLKTGKVDKARKLFEHAVFLQPQHPDILTGYGLFTEKIGGDVVKANFMHKGRTQPIVQEIDAEMMRILDQKRNKFLRIPRGSSGLRRAMREAYFSHIYHTVAMEGNTMNFVQTKSLLETRMAIGGKSIMEHNEILGMDAALRFVNQSLIHRIGSLTVEDILDIHRRVLGFVDPVESGRFRTHQVYIGSFEPSSPENIEKEVDELLEWLNSDTAMSIHPVELAALLHYKFVVIHPFVDGNGRTSRLLMNLILMQAGFPPVIIRVEDRLQYYESLKLANEGDLRPFVRFIAECTRRTLDEYLANSMCSVDEASNPLEPIVDNGRTIIVTVFIGTQVYLTMNSMGGGLTFRQRRPYNTRVREIQEIRRAYPDKIPIVIERFEGEKYLPVLDRCKFLVPDHVTMTELMQIVRRRLELHPEQALFLLVNEKSLVSHSTTLAELYEAEKDTDGFLYIVYTSQPGFGLLLIQFY
ncbi:Adenosine monophosphate-protein transferase FICD [Trichinella pseudospiralis]|uniref:protein adenylyltransferase n=1 Tax=Trichinella pseudospiralis TaxID=6337 RepID=A0A0V1IFU4_TRIPS|nr:Adenosine monophosphate-protein transferase FICD [Trichinella pseudospiralis]